MLKEQVRKISKNSKHEYRCPICNRKLMTGKIVNVKTRCPKCKNFIKLRD